MTERMTEAKLALILEATGALPYQPALRPPAVESSPRTSQQGRAYHEEEA